MFCFQFFAVFGVWEGPEELGETGEMNKFYLSGLCWGAPKSSPGTSATLPQNRPQTDPEPPLTVGFATPRPPLTVVFAPLTPSLTLGSIPAGYQECDLMHMALNMFHKWQRLLIIAYSAEQVGDQLSAG